MTNSWDWVEKHNRRERNRKRMRLVGLILAIGLLLSVVDLPSIFKQTDDDERQETTTIENADGASVSIEDASLGQSNSERPLPPRDAKSALDANAGSVPVEFGEVQAWPQAEVSSTPASQPNPVLESPGVKPEQQQIAERAIAKLKQKIERLDGDDSRLEKFGGAEWTSIRALAESAFQADDPVIAAQTAEQAITQLEALTANLDYAEFWEQTRGNGDRENVAALVKFRGTHSDHPRLHELEQSLLPLTREKWLAMAVEELEQASPDDAGFSEGWLPIASAWQLVGNDDEARDALRQALAALPHMTLPERVIEATMEICQHELFDRSSAKQTLETAAEMCAQVSNVWERSTYYAQLSGLSGKLNQQELSSDFLARSLALIEKDGLGSVWQKQTLTQEARAASWTGSPESIFAIATKIEKLNYPEPTVNANAYGHAAIAAARHNDRTQFLKAMLLTENALAPVGVYEYPNYLYAVRLAEANILQRRWRAAVIVANNIPDPYIRATLLFRILRDAPQEIHARNLPGLFATCSEQRGAAPACAASAEYRLRSGESLLSVTEWTQSLPLASQRAAAFAGISRTIGTPTDTDIFREEEPHLDSVDINDSVSLMDAAERVAHQIQEPLDSAFVWLQIARTSNLLGKRQRYQQALSNLDDRLFDAWSGVWEERPPVKRSFNGGYIDSDNRHRDDEQRTVGLIIACHHYLTEMQADLGDSDGALESCLNWANAAGFLNETATCYDMNFVRIKALLNRLQATTGVGPDVVPLLEHRAHRYTRALLAAWAKDLPGLEAALPELVEHASRSNGSASERAQPARAFGELAILYAERGNLEGYRKARRSAQSLITEGRAGSEMKLVLATADALAGELALAESNLVRGALKAFGDMNRPRQQLSVALAAEGQWEKAMEHAEKISTTQPLYRAEAWAAVAEARRKDDSQSQADILEWIDSLTSQVDRAGAYCGLSLATASTQ